MNKELPIYVTDTHGFIWYLTDSPKLGKNANECFQEIDQGKAKLLIPAIVIAEIIYIVQNGKIDADLDSLIQRIQEAENFEISLLGPRQLLCFRNQTEVPEMHDRLIVCEAIQTKARLITKDKAIRNSGIIETVW